LDIELDGALAPVRGHRRMSDPMVTARAGEGASVHLMRRSGCGCELLGSFAPTAARILRAVRGPV